MYARDSINSLQNVHPTVYNLQHTSHVAQARWNARRRLNNAMLVWRIYKAQTHMPTLRSICTTHAQRTSTMHTPICCSRLHIHHSPTHTLPQAQTRPGG